MKMYKLGCVDLTQAEAVSLSWAESYKELISKVLCLLLRYSTFYHVPFRYGTDVVNML